MRDKKHTDPALHVKGSITEAIGKLTGDKIVEAQGAAQKREAKKRAVSVRKDRDPK